MRMEIRIDINARTPGDAVSSSLRTYLSLDGGVHSGAELRHIAARAGPLEVPNVSPVPIHHAA